MKQEHYGDWPLRYRLELLAFEAELARLPRTLIVALWEVIDQVGSSSDRSSMPGRSPPGGKSQSNAVVLPGPSG
jgi:hypothetical protein